MTNTTAVFLADPTQTNLNLVPNKGLALRMLEDLPDFSGKLYFYWSQGRKVDVVNLMTLFLRIKNTEPVYTIVYETNEELRTLKEMGLNTSILERRITNMKDILDEYNQKDLLVRLIRGDTFNLEEAALVAAREGRVGDIRKLIEHGATNENLVHKILDGGEW